MISYGALVKTKRRQNSSLLEQATDNNVLTPIGVLVAVVEFDVNPLDVGRRIFVFVGLQIERPLVRVAVLFAFLAEIPR